MFHPCFHLKVKAESEESDLGFESSRETREKTIETRPEKLYEGIWGRVNKSLKHDWF